MRSIDTWTTGEMRIHFNLKQTRESERLTQIMLVANLGKQRVRIYTRMRVRPKYWSVATNRCNLTGKMTRRERMGLESINKQIERMTNLLRETDNRLAMNGEPMTEAMVRHVMNELLHDEERTLKPLPYLRHLAEEYVNSINRKGRRGHDSSVDTYLTALRRLEEYDRQRKVPICSFDDFDKRFFTEFTDFLYSYTYERGGERKHYTQNTIVNTLKVVKNLLHRAYDNEATTNDYFMKVQTALPADISEPVYLEEKEIKRLAAVHTLTDTEREVRDVFVIACYTALRISDIRRLNEAVIRDGIITLYQTKTQERVEIPILKEIATLVEYYRERGFPIINKVTANRIIKTLAARCHIDTPVSYRECRGGVSTVRTVPKWSLVSFHTARRSCVTNLYKRGYPVNYVMTLSGHRSMQAFQRYMRASSKEVMAGFVHLLKKDKALPYASGTLPPSVIENP